MTNEPTNVKAEAVEEAPQLDDKGFWRKVGQVAAKAGRELLVLVLTAYYCLRDDDTPTWAKTVIVGSLVYFVSPLDAIPDYLPGGLVDDAGVVAAALLVVAAHVKPEHRERAQEQVDRIFGREQHDRGDVR